ncbi:MAG: MBL fold metallo-hydrolase, partial [Oscillospiraceae bacterium]
LLLTHEHIDHLRGLRVLLRQNDLPVYATGAVLRYLVENGQVEPGATLVEIEPGTPFEAAGMRVTAFSTPHDAADSVGYRIETPDAHTLAVATDLGHVSETVRRGTAGCELVMLESNYDPALLRMGPYPYFLKQRIAADNGHLENERSAEFACRLLESGCTRMILAHLSRENNSPALAYQMTSGALQAMGASEGSDYTLDVAPYDGAGRLIRF